MHALALYLLLAATAASAPPIPWPKPVGPEIEFTATQPKDLPRGLTFEKITVEHQEPHTVGICWIDLNKDGTPELLVDSNEGGTGGSYKQIFAKTRSGFRRIAGWQGGITLLPAANGYLQFESWSSAGGGQFSRMLFRYERGRYRMVRLEDWRGTDGDDGWEFIGSRDPKEYDHE